MTVATKQPFLQHDLLDTDFWIFKKYGIGAADCWLDKPQDDGKWVAKAHLELSRTSNIELFAENS